MATEITYLALNFDTSLFEGWKEKRNTKHAYLQLFSRLTEKIQLQIERIERSFNNPIHFVYRIYSLNAIKKDVILFST